MIEEKISFKKEFECLINKHSMENGSDTPDFILANYLQNCLIAFDKAVKSRETWYGRDKKECCIESSEPVPF